jgi:hypothetical protein
MPEIVPCKEPDSLVRHVTVDMFVKRCSGILYRVTRGFDGSRPLNENGLAKRIIVFGYNYTMAMRIPPQRTLSTEESVGTYLALWEVIYVT